MRGEREVFLMVELNGCCKLMIADNRMEDSNILCWDTIKKNFIKTRLICLLRINTCFGGLRHRKLPGLFSKVNTL